MRQKISIRPVKSPDEELSDATAEHVFLEAIVKDLVEKQQFYPYINTNYKAILSSLKKAYPVLYRYVTFLLLSVQGNKHEVNLYISKIPTAITSAQQYRNTLGTTGVYKDIPEDTFILDILLRFSDPSDYRHARTNLKKVITTKNPEDLLEYINVTDPRVAAIVKYRLENGI